MLPKAAHALLLTCVFGLLVSCGGGGGSDPQVATPPPPPPPVAVAAYPDIPQTDEDAARFLIQATFGPTRTEIARLRLIGYRKWIDEQLSPVTSPPTLVLPHLQQIVTNGVPRDDLRQSNRRNYWLWQAAVAPDQLRMRMGFALSEILVVSDRAVADGNTTLFRIADYQDTLSRGAFGSYRELLDKVSLHPAMGYFLSHVGNRKADPVKNVTPDENYGREIMQLFTIGLVERRLDFSPIVDGNGQVIPTYDQQVVGAMARVFTGWAYAGQTDKQFGNNNNTSYAPMECHPTFHDPDAKEIFKGIVIPAGTDCAASLKLALDALANHSNTAPFVSRQLIQRFVTSNPSPAYISRVANVWKSSQGNLGQVIRAILLDDEARVPVTGAGFGKAREPLVKIATIWRAFEAKYVPYATGEVRFFFSDAFDLTNSLAQDSLRAPSVFNFFEPDFRMPAAGNAAGIFAPEFQILTEATYFSALNQHDSVVWNYTGAPPTERTNAPILDISRLVSLADVNNHAGMVQELNVLLFAGTLSATSGQTMVTMLDRLKAANQTSSVRARSLIQIALASPEFAVQR